MGFASLLVATVAGLVALWITHALNVREAYLAQGLAPQGSQSAVKDLCAFAMTSLPRVVRTIKTGTGGFDLSGDEPRWRALEGPHIAFQFSESALHPSKLVESKYFAENYYVWMSDLESDFLVTTRLSFYGTNASTVIPWFTFQLGGEEWNLPEDFAPVPHLLASQEREAVDRNGLGRLWFSNPKPMREWTIRYSGVVENRAKTRRENVTADFTLLFSERDVFSYQLHWDEMATALSLAGKPWDEAFFKNLRSQNQERYASKAQSGSGFVQFAGQDKVAFAGMQASRDHLWGIRNWVFMPRYVWWPPIALKRALVIDNVAYTSFIGAFVEYGNTMANMVVGGLVSDEGKVASFSGATHMRDIAKAWYDEPPTGVFIGERLVPGDLHLEIGLLGGEYVMEVNVQRGAKHGLWSHTFSLAEGRFEIHEALARFEFTVRRFGANRAVVSNSTAAGLFEFGATVVPVASYADGE